MLGEEVISTVQSVLPFGDSRKVEWESFLVEVGYKEKYKWQVTEKKQGTKNLLDKGVQWRIFNVLFLFFKENLYIHCNEDSLKLDFFP